MNLMDVNREFRTEEDYLEELAKVRWPDGWYPAHGFIPTPSKAHFPC